MKSTLAVIALTALLAGAPAFAATNASDSGMSQTQDTTTQKQRHKKHAHKSKHAKKHAKRHSKSSDSTAGMGTSQQ